MSNVLDQLYKGNLYPYSRTKTTIEELKKNKDKALKEYTNFHEKLPGDLKEEFEKLMDDHFDVLAGDLEQNFIDGFRIGVRLMIEVFNDSNIN